ncbi:radical SAM peptide maturase [Draconibacterium orientale]|uniref:radical SAM peptide maturase n=1 Tax=Draconibacterium orientale TaxID=1168034 RepID=UPI002ABE7771|nr:radical SAM peptide maturase [Draconibacterium orientale]
METKESIRYNLQHLNQIVFEVTDECNLSCKYCSYSSMYEGYDTRSRTKMQFDIPKTIIDHVIKIRDSSPNTNYPLTISFYGGEPLLNFSLIRKVVEYIKNTYSSKKINYGMTTNAMLLHKYMDYLKSNNFQLTISLDGGEKAQGYRVDHKGSNSFMKVFKNVHLLKLQYPEYFESNVNFNSVMHNLNSAESAFRFIKQNFNKKTTLSALSASGIKKEKMEEFKKMYQNVSDSILSSNNIDDLETDMFIKSPRVLDLVYYIVKYSQNFFKDYNDLIYDLSFKNKRRTGTCSPFSKKMFITVDGKILQCERIGHQFAMGQVTGKNIQLNPEEIANSQNKFINKLREQCNKCSLKKICPQCIYRISNITEKNPICNQFANKKEFEKLIETTTNFLSEHPSYYERILNEVKID